jgi:PTS system nitrogen regulatory IIA component
MSVSRIGRRANLRIKPMDLSDLLHAEGVLPSLRVNSKKQALQELAVRAAAITGVGEREIFDVLLQREKLGSTGVGHGVAIPHGKIAGLAGIVGVFARLEKPIDFDALDDDPVDLLFLLLAPEDAGADHLKALARIARALRDPATAGKLRDTRDAAALYALLTEPAASSDAA